MPGSHSCAPVVCGGVRGPTRPRTRRGWLMYSVTVSATGAGWPVLHWSSLMAR